MVVYGILQYQNIPQKARKLPFWYSMVVYGIFRFRALLSMTIYICLSAG